MLLLRKYREVTLCAAGTRALEGNTDHTEPHNTIIFFWHFSFIYLSSLTPNMDLSLRLFPGRELRSGRKQLSGVSGILGRHGPAVIKPAPAPLVLPAAKSLDLDLLLTCERKQLHVLGGRLPTRTIPRLAMTAFTP